MAGGNLGASVPALNEASEQGGEGCGSRLAGTLTCCRKIVPRLSLSQGQAVRHNDMLHAGSRQAAHSHRAPAA